MNKLIADYVYLAEASYADFSQSTNHEQNIINNDEPANFAKLVTQNYEVIAHHKDVLVKDGGTSFSATLFKQA